MILVYSYVYPTHRIIAVGDMMKEAAHNILIPKWSEEVEHKAGRELSNHYPVSVDLKSG